MLRAAGCGRFAVSTAPRRRGCQVAVRVYEQRVQDVTPELSRSPSFSRYTVSLKKPMGIVLEEDKTGSIYVVEVKPDGSAAAEGQVQVGDQLVATSGVVYKKELDYGGAKVKGGQEIIRLSVQGETFKTVSAAIGSHPGHIPVTLELQRRSA